ncbi:MAG: ATP-dependent Clp protease ATP-binding subunit [Candidatus Taylorbacteria bacterium]|nr:ATP-dependent Clp protease ATP-binding subunit [Candidatus Taylorbacteria bacterium]
MDIDALKKAIAPFYPALVLDRLFHREAREAVEKVFNIIAIIFFILALLGKVEGFTHYAWPKEISFVVRFLETWQPASLGIFLMALSIAILTFAVRAFYDSYYFSNVKTVMPETAFSGNKNPLTFEASEVVLEGIEHNDITGAFVRSRLGSYAFFRLGIPAKSIYRFLSERAHVASLKDFKFAQKGDAESVGFGDIAESIVAGDAEFFKFLSALAVTAKEFSGASAWAERMETGNRLRQRYWGRDSLGRISGIGKDWAYGGSYTLEKFAHDVTDRGVLNPSDMAGNRLTECNELEAVLARSSESNALLVAEEGADPLGVVFCLGERIERGSVLPPLEHKRLYLFDGNSFAAFAKNKAVFESELLHILNESVRAGNVILIFPDLPTFMESAKSLGSDLISLLDNYLAHPNFQVIAITDPGSYHSVIETQSKILHRFERIQIAERDERATMEAIQDRAVEEEARAKVFFTYQSLSAVADGAKRYLSEGVVSDKALHLLAEVVPVVQSKKKTTVEREDVLSLIEAKTGIPTGEVTNIERDKLMNLEEVLHQRIVGQHEAIVAISGALRRSRSDITNPERPMGSFLFLGPTGVGKTETTKALASVFFNSEDTVIRLDMTEYQTSDALKRLIGSFEDSKPGVLSSRLREQSYGVLLLDEFEKTNKEVLDLFLQILDEGFFSDSSGKRVNARNLIIIATSNAGSDMIWNLMREGKDLNKEKDTIVNEVINRGVFKPELLNRFDGVILFHPLSSEDLEKIAGLMLKKLQKRLAGKGIELVINDVLLKAVISAGTDPQFGARPMNRAIQEKVEQVIAKKIISGEAKSGSRIELTPEELA